MKRKIGLAIVLLILIYNSNYIIAQDEIKKEKSIKIGIGVAFPNLLENFFFSGQYPIVYIPMVFSNFIIEPEFNYYNEKKDDNSDYTSIEKRNRIGIGLFRKSNKAKGVMYYGFRLGLASYFRERSNNEGNSYTYEMSKTFFGPAIGGEYYFSPYFSLGGEVGFRRDVTKTENKDDYYGSQSSTYDIISNTTKATIILRYYF